MPRRPRTAADRESAGLPPIRPAVASPKSGVSRRSQANAWYEMRDRLHVERSKLRGAVLVQAATIMSACAAETCASVEDFVRAVMWNGYDTFAGAASDLGESVPVCMRGAVVDALLEWHRSADARLGEYPNVGR